MRYFIASFLTVLSVIGYAHSQMEIRGNVTVSGNLLISDIAPYAGGGPAAAIVQSTMNMVGGTNVNPIDFLSNVTAGNLIQVDCSCYDTPGPCTITTVADTLLNTYTLVHTSGTVNNANMSLHRYFAANIGGGANIVTATFGAGNDDSACSVTEISGLSTSSPLVGKQTGSATSALADGGEVNSGVGAKLVSGAVATMEGSDTFTAFPLGGSTRIAYSPDNNTRVGLGVSVLGTTSTIVDTTLYNSSWTVANTDWIAFTTIYK